jgi:hypothetical protein
MDFVLSWRSSREERARVGLPFVGGKYVKVQTDGHRLAAARDSTVTNLILATTCDGNDGATNGLAWDNMVNVLRTPVLRTHDIAINAFANWVAQY